MKETRVISTNTKIRMNKPSELKNNDTDNIVICLIGTIEGVNTNALITKC